MLKNLIKNEKELPVTKRILAGALAVLSALVLPEIFHILGLISGLGSSLGEIFLPMHLPIILAGFLIGPYVGAVSGAIAPLVSFLVSGMPSVALLPFMVIELTFYGLVAGLLREKKMNSFLGLTLVQIGGRAARAVAILVAVYIIGFSSISPAIIYTSIVKGLFGILLQWVVIPLTLYRIKNKS